MASRELPQLERKRIALLKNFQRRFLQLHLVTWSMSNICQLVAMGQQTNIWGRDCASLCSDGGNQFNPACALNQRALPYWVGGQYSFETLQTENWRVRGIPGFFFSSLWSKGQSLGPHRVQLAIEFCGWYCILFNLDLNACQPWGCVGL